MQEAYGVHLTPDNPLYHRLRGPPGRRAPQLDEEAWSGAWEEGKAMPLERAIEYALSEEERSGSLPPRAGEEQPLTVNRRNAHPPRARGRGSSSARGLTNRGISSELSISEHTVDTHVRNVLKKLGLNSRARIGSELMRS